MDLAERGSGVPSNEDFRVWLESLDSRYGSRILSGFPRILHWLGGLVAASDTNGVEVRGLVYGADLIVGAMSTCSVDDDLMCLHVLGIVAPSHFHTKSSMFTNEYDVAAGTRSRRRKHDQSSDHRAADGYTYVVQYNVHWYWGRGERWWQIPGLGW